jgi:iron(III) transport system substrate-binding protein
MKRRQFVAAVSATAASATLLGSRPARSAPNGEVTFYTSTSDDITPMIKSFNAIYPDIKVKMITGEGGTLLTRLRAEKARPQCDVVNLSADALLNYPELFKPYKSKEDAAFEPWGIIRNGDTIYGYGFTISIQTFAYNSQRLAKADVPTSWQDMLSPRFKGKYVVANPVISTAGYGSLSQVIQTYGWDGVQKYIDTARFSQNTDVIPQNVARGEEALVITEETKAGNLTRAGYPVVVTYPSEGVAPTVEGIGLVKNGPNGDNGLIFAEFLNSKDGHGFNVKFRNRRTPRKDSAPPVGLPPSSALKINPKYDFLDGVHHHDEWIAKFASLLQAKSR